MRYVFTFVGREEKKNKRALIHTFRPYHHVHMDLFRCTSQQTSNLHIDPEKTQRTRLEGIAHKVSSFCVDGSLVQSKLETMKRDDDDGINNGDEQGPRTNALLMIGERREDKRQHNYSTPLERERSSLIIMIILFLRDVVECEIN